MAINSTDALVDALTSGQTARYDWNKLTGGSAYAVGRWYDMSMIGALPIANAWAGTALAWKTCDEATGNGTQIFGMPHGGNVSPSKKHLLNMQAWTTAATSAPAVQVVADFTVTEEEMAAVAMLLTARVNAYRRASTGNPTPIHWAA